MAKFVTQITLKDFLKVHPGLIQDYYLKKGNEKFFPIAIAIHKDSPHGGYFGKYIGYNSPVFLAEKTKHIYSTRDYWEVVREEEPNFRYKLPKDETNSIYLVIAEDD